MRNMSLTAAQGFIQVAGDYVREHLPILECLPGFTPLDPKAVNADLVALNERQEKAKAGKKPVAAQVRREVEDLLSMGQGIAEIARGYWRTHGMEHLVKSVPTLHRRSFAACVDHLDALRGYVQDHLEIPDIDREGFATRVKALQALKNEQAAVNVASKPLTDELRRRVDKAVRYLVACVEILRGYAKLIGDEAMRKAAPKLPKSRGRREPPATPETPPPPVKP